MKTWQTVNGVIVRQLLGGRSNSFLIQDRNHTAIVDTGRRYRLKSLLNRIHEAGATTIDYLILTHTHFDHAENAAYLQTYLPSPLFIRRFRVPFSGDCQGCQAFAIFMG
jgi:glyoxylase-like metal-dependent hydrolase (beta-lactamase superfamily II)